MADYSAPHIVGYVEGFGFGPEELERVRRVLAEFGNVLPDTIEVKLVNEADIPGCGFVANIADSRSYVIDDILNVLRTSKTFASVSGFQINDPMLLRHMHAAEVVPVNL